MINIDGLDKEVCGTPRPLAHLMNTDSSTEGERQQPEDVEPELEEAARGESEYVRERLGEELGREPTAEEIDEWLRQHTEGY